MVEDNPVLFSSTRTRRSDEGVLQALLLTKTQSYFCCCWTATFEIEYSGDSREPQNTGNSYAKVHQLMDLLELMLNYQVKFHDGT